MVDASSSESLRVARVIHSTTAEGPGKRTALWVQGCSIRCKGCINPHLFTFSGGILSKPEDIVQKAVEVGDEGITLLGGEPLDQIEAVANLARQAQEAGLGVICFTGYPLERALAMPGGDDLLGHVDLLVDGPYVADDPDAERALVGSTNQRFVHLTGRYNGYDPVRAADRVHLRILPNGEVSIAGFMTAQRTAQVASALGARRSFKS